MNNLGNKNNQIKDILIGFCGIISIFSLLFKFHKSDTLYLHILVNDYEISQGKISNILENYDGEGIIYYVDFNFKTKYSNNLIKCNSVPHLGLNDDFRDLKKVIYVKSNPKNAKLLIPIDICLHWGMYLAFLILIIYLLKIIYNSAIQLFESERTLRACSTTKR